MSVSYILFGNGVLPARFLEALPDSVRPPALVVLNAAPRQRQAEQIRDACAARDIDCMDWSAQTRERVLSRLGRHDDWLLSIYFGHILDRGVLQAAGGKAVNLHPSLLPLCRGAHTNVWPIIEGAPAGVTLHVMEPAVDTGAILQQTSVPVLATDTAQTLHARLEQAAFELLRDSWPDKVLEAWPGKPQRGPATTHRVQEFASLESVELEEGSPELAFFNLLRARTFPPYPGLRIRIGQDIVEATINLREAE